MVLQVVSSRSEIERRVRKTYHVHHRIVLSGMLLDLGKGKPNGAVWSSDRRVVRVRVKDVADSTQVWTGRSGWLLSLHVERHVTLDRRSWTELRKLRRWSSHGVSRLQHGSYTFALQSHLLELLGVELLVVLMLTHFVGRRDGRV